MDFSFFQKKIVKSYLRTAEFLGEEFTQYRPSSPFEPLTQVYCEAVTCFLDSRISMSCNSAPQRNNPVRFFVSENSDIVEGDFFRSNVNKNNLIFISFLEKIRPSSAILTNGYISILETVKPEKNISFGLNEPQGQVFTSDSIIVSDWPVSILDSAGSKTVDDVLVTSLGQVGKVVLMSYPPGTEIKIGQRVRDHQGSNYHIRSVECTEFGLRLHMVVDQL
ncbi:MAG: hypothetical protein LKH33_04775 [Acetobacter sp.]|jgi:hypothetical protein|nr:hypothetical protein [Acetobacter sp.]MCH4062055.1 hypothetical protein [Acetobacter sp.]MCH4089096.1 hypothetical protein [Acetobacter sp.]MCI1293178.1 hypothetical protein [Acetobacter sp.]MCI1320197.1 hypothetical protein [Acetobacter sp.]